jgi:hypothetical protein
MFSQRWVVSGRNYLKLTWTVPVTGAKPDQWKQIRDEVVGHLHDYSEALLRSIQVFAEIGDVHGVEIIQNSCVGCLAHLAILCNFIGRWDPSYKPQMDVICDWSLEQLGDLTKAINFDEYTYLDLLLRVRSWLECPWERKHDSRVYVRFRGRGH